jgi:hypothetical protein
VAVAWVDSVSVRFLVCALWMGILLQRQPLGPANIPPGDLDFRRFKERGPAHWHGSTGYVARCGMVVAMVLQCICPGPGMCLPVPPEHLRVRTAVVATSQWPHDTPQLPFDVLCVDWSSGCFKWCPRWLSASQQLGRNQRMAESDGSGMWRSAGCSTHVNRRPKRASQVVNISGGPVSLGYTMTAG